MEDKEMYEKILDRIDKKDELQAKRMQEMENRITNTLKNNNDKRDVEIGALFEKTGIHSSDLKVLNKEIYGNGKPGILTRLIELEKDCVSKNEFLKLEENIKEANIKTEANKLWINDKKSQLAVIAFIITAVAWYFKG